MPVEKEILRPAEALRVTAEAKENRDGARGEGALPTPPRFKFVKNFGVGDVLRFEDGTTFSFRKIQRNTGGYASNSFVITDDEKLAQNLREASRNKALGIVEVKL